MGHTEVIALDEDHARQQWTTFVLHAYQQNGTNPLPAVPRASASSRVVRRASAPWRLWWGQCR